MSRSSIICTLFVMTLVNLSVMCVYVCPLNNISLYYSAYIQFCQVFFLIIIICDSIALDKIDKRVYNVIRYHQGGLYIYTIDICTYPLGIFQGILSEYLALKYGPQVVYMDFRDFLVTGYIYPPMVGCALAYPCDKSRSITKKIEIALVYG